MSNLTGASFLASQFREMIAASKAKLAQAGDDMKLAVAELHDTADHAIAQVKMVQTETAELKAALGLGSNGGPALDEPHFTPTPKVEYETPAPFYGPAQPYDDTGQVTRFKLANGE